MIEEQIVTPNVPQKWLRIALYCFVLIAGLLVMHHCIALQLIAEVYELH